VILAFLGISQNCFCIGKVMDRVYESWDHGWLSVHGGLATMGQRGRSKAWEVIVIAWREGEEVLVLTNGATWRQSCGDVHMTVLNKGGWWCSNEELVLGVRRRDWSWGRCGG
jgi:hypothetical protein